VEKCLLEIENQASQTAPFSENMGVTLSTFLAFTISMLECHQSGQYHGTMIMTKNYPRVQRSQGQISIVSLLHIINPQISRIT
jgi:hypothetical protein